jgi:hypothetical protein
MSRIMDVCIDAAGNLWVKGKGVADEFVEYH